MKIGDRCFVHGYVDEIRKDTVIVRNNGGYFGTDPGEVIVVNDMAHPNWIPCSERLPEEGQKCLVYDKAIGFRVDTYIGHGNPYNWELFVRDYEAWMPLPDPYTEEKKE